MSEIAFSKMYSSLANDVSFETARCRHGHRGVPTRRKRPLCPASSKAAPSSAGETVFGVAFFDDQNTLAIA